MWSTAAGGGDTRGQEVGARPVEFRLGVTSCGSGGAWRKYPAPGRGLPPTCSPVPGFVIAQKSVSACDVARAQEHHGREEGSAVLLPAGAWPACCSFCLSAAPLSFGSRVPVESLGEMVLGGPHQSEEAGAEQWAWDASQGGPVFTHPGYPGASG